LVAIAYEDGSLFVFDTRNPAVVLHELPEDKLQRRKSLFHRRAGGERVTNVSWTISGIKKGEAILWATSHASDPISPESRPRVRLVVVFDSGAARVYTFDKAPQSGAWSAALSGDADGIAGAFADPDSSVVLDAKTGYRCRADTHGLTTALDPDLLAAAGTRKTEKHYIWVLAGAKGARVNMDVNGERIAKADWPSKAGTVTQAKVVERTGKQL
jgi:syntaxin-binding protein 5